MAAEARRIQESSEAKPYWDAAKVVRFDKSKWKHDRVAIIATVPPSARHLLEVYLRWADPTGFVWLSRDNLARETGYKAAAMSRAASALERAKLIRRVPTKNRPNRIQIIQNDVLPLFEAQLESTEGGAQARTDQCAGAHTGVRERAPDGAQARTQSSEAAMSSGSPASPPGSFVDVLQALERWKGAVLTISEEAIVRQYLDMLEEHPITIHSVSVGHIDLAARAVSEAIASSAAYNTIHRGMKLIKAICERCMRDGLWPGEFDDKCKRSDVRSSGARYAPGRDSRARATTEREARNRHRC